jgi:hypothetical protein
MSTTEVTPETVEPLPAEAAPGSLYEYAKWIHVGPGADGCEHCADGQCDDNGHFHAWCRQPNDFQEREIGQRALAAKARKIRQLRLGGSDSNEVLETLLEELVQEADFKSLAAAELVGYDWADDLLAATRLVRDQDDPSEDAGEDDKLFAHIDEDEQRFVKLSSLDPEEREGDEFLELQEHLAAYHNAVGAALEGITKPKMDSYEAMEETDLLNLLRRKRIEHQGRLEFNHWYTTHKWLSCSYDQVEGLPVFADLAALTSAPDKVISALRETYGSLDRKAQEALGN